MKSFVFQLREMGFPIAFNTTVNISDCTERHLHLACDVGQNDAMITQEYVLRQHQMNTAIILVWVVFKYSYIQFAFSSENTIFLIINNQL